MKKNTYTDVVFSLIEAHTKLWAWSAVYGDIAPVASITSVPQYIAASQRLLMIDVVSYLENTADKETALESLVGQMDYYKNQWSQLKTQLQEVVQEKTLDYNQCTSTKESGDRWFYQWLREWDANSMVAWLEESKKWAWCQAIARVDGNAHKVLQQRVTDISTTLSSVSTLLSQNRSTIIANFSLFKDQNLEKLISLRNELRSKSPWTN